MFFEWNGDDFCLLSLFPSEENPHQNKEDSTKSKSDFEFVRHHMIKTQTKKTKADYVL